jgi:hypothetical protein
MRSDWSDEHREAGSVQPGSADAGSVSHVADAASIRKTVAGWIEKRDIQQQANLSSNPDHV